jgi:hypothetical protein
VGACTVTTPIVPNGLNAAWPADSALTAL